MKTGYQAIGVNGDAIDTRYKFKFDTAKGAASSMRGEIQHGDTVIVRGPRGGITYWCVGAIGAYKVAGQ